MDAIDYNLSLKRNLTETTKKTLAYISNLRRDKTQQKKT